MAFTFGAGAPPSGGFGTGAGGFGSNANTGFGSTATASPFGGGGGSSAFGSNTTSFGAPSSTTSAFGAPKTTGGFGTGGFGTSSQPSSIVFGQPSQTSAFGSAAPGGNVFASGGTSAFGTSGTSSGFGTTGTSGFGTSSALGTGGGGFGSAATSTPFGAQSPSPFGAKPAASAASPFGSTGMFGSNTAQPGATSAFGTGTSGAFGSTTSTFGNASTGSVFGGGSTLGGTTGGFGTAQKSPFSAPAAPATSAFGAQQSTFGSFSAPANQVQQVGTGNPPYQVTREVEGTGSSNYISISRMQPYAHKSVEELRYEDYLKRTNPAAAQAAAALNAPAATSTAMSSGFGTGTTGTGMFGATSQPATPGFGATTSAFGAPTTTTGFGATAGGFGTSSAFGTTPNTGSTFGFGQQQPQQQQSGSLFGQSTTGSTFGTSAPMNQPSGGFGAPSTGFGATSTGFGSGGGFGTGSFGAPPSSTTSSFGFGSTPNSGGFGTSVFNKPATSTAGTGFGFGASSPAPASSGFNFGGGTAQQPGTQTPSLFGSTANSAGTSQFGFGGAAKPATSSSFSFGGPTPGGFGTTSSFGAPAPAASQGPSSSFFGGGSTGGFGFGTSTAPSTGTSLFGGSTANKGTSLFGGGATPGVSTGFGGGSSSNLFGSTPGTGGFGSSFGTGSTFGTGGLLTGGSTAAPSTGFGGFGGFGSLNTTPAAPGAQNTGLFAQNAVPQNLVASPDVNPYGSGSCGAGLVEQNVKAALEAHTLKVPPTARSSAFSHDVGLSRGPSDIFSSNSRRGFASSRLSIPISYIRGASFKGSKSRLPMHKISLVKSTATGVESAELSDDFKFSSSLFRGSSAKKLVIEKPDPVSMSDMNDHGDGSRAVVVPLSEESQSDSESSKSKPLPIEADGSVSLNFRVLKNQKMMSLRVFHSNSIVRVKREVLQHLKSLGVDLQGIQLVLKGRLLHDDTIVDEIEMREDEIIEVVEAEEDSARAEASNLNKAPKGRFMTYNEFLKSAIRESENEETKDEMEGPNACPILTKQGYYTVPSYENLQRMSDSELAKVERFTVGCKGLGSVEWIGLTDVRHLNLDDLITFEKKEVIVYKDDEDKHELGTGLNKPAIVELLGVFAPKKASEEKYRERVKRRTEDIGATFLDYSGETGIWRFRVEHFSRYGFEEEEDSDVDMVEEEVNQTQLKLTHHERKMVTSSRSSLGRIDAVMNADHAALLKSSRLRHVEEQQHSVASFSSALVEHQEPEPESSDFQMNDSYSSEEVIDSPAPSPLLCVFEQTEIDLLRVKPLGIDQVSSKLSSGDKSSTFLLAQSVADDSSSVTTNSVDFGLSMARSFRCSWGPNGELANVGRFVTKGASTWQHGIVSVELPLSVNDMKKNQVQENLILHQKYAESDERESLVAAPCYSLPSTSSLLNCLCEYVSFAEAAERSSSSFTRRKVAFMWKLVHALWGQEHPAVPEGESSGGFFPLASRDDPREVESLQNFQGVDLRRESISKWFEDALSSIDVGMLATNKAVSHEAILKLLCRHQVVEASNMAIDLGDFRLATLISQIQSYDGSEFRTFMMTQVDQWTEKGALEFMDHEVSLIYSLLGGSVEVVTDQLDLAWLSSLALYFWYKRGPSTSLKSALGAFFEGVKNGLAKAPASPFEDEKNDILMELMKLYCNEPVSLCSVLSPSGYMDGNHLDYEVAWHLQSVLRAIGFKIDRKWESHVHQNFIRQLENTGLWQEALYVSLNISEFFEREVTCRAILSRNVNVIARDEVENLRAKFHIPSNWIHEAIAINCSYNGRTHEEIAHLIVAQHYGDAHDSIMQNLAITSIFTGDNGILYDLLVALEPFDAEIPNWEQQGWVFLEYLRVLKTSGEWNVTDGKELYQRLIALRERLESFEVLMAPWKRTDQEMCLADSCLASMRVTLSTKIMPFQCMLEDQVAFSGDEQDSVKSFSGLSAGAMNKFSERFRASHLLDMCSSFVEWRCST